MPKYKATMPREKPPVGKAHLVFAFVNHHGTRQELTSIIDANEAQRMMGNAIQLSCTKPQPSQHNESEN